MSPSFDDRGTARRRHAPPDPPGVRLVSSRARTLARHDGPCVWGSRPSSLQLPPMRFERPFRASGMCSSMPKATGTGIRFSAVCLVHIVTSGVTIPSWRPCDGLRTYQSGSRPARWSWKFDGISWSRCCFRSTHRNVPPPVVTRTARRRPWAHIVETSKRVRRGRLSCCSASACVIRTGWSRLHSNPCSSRSQRGSLSAPRRRGRRGRSGARYVGAGWCSGCRAADSRRGGPGQRTPCYPSPDPDGCVAGPDRAVGPLPTA